jgi:hypothetical protein
MCTVSNTICICGYVFNRKLTRFLVLVSVEIVGKFKDNHNGKNFENWMEVCLYTASYGLDEDKWQAVVNKVRNIEVPHNVCNCILSAGRIWRQYVLLKD